LKPFLSISKNNRSSSSWGHDDPFFGELKYSHP
jgi:hypothetical protein